MSAKRVIQIIGLIIILIAGAVFWGGRNYATRFSVQKVDLQTKNDGVYEGSAYMDPIKVTVQVEIKDHKITNVKIVRHDNGIGFRAEVPVVERILKEQTNDVEAVSGATISSKAIMNAVGDALK